MSASDALWKTMNFKRKETDIMKKNEKRETSIQSKQTESLADLPLTDEQAEETRAGTGTHGAELASFYAFGGFSGGVSVASSDIGVDADQKAGQLARSNRNNS
jgi:hypothetical protein